jgi:hypothetical protein
LYISKISIFNVNFLKFIDLNAVVTILTVLAFSINMHINVKTKLIRAKVTVTQYNDFLSIPNTNILYLPIIAEKNS